MEVGGIAVLKGKGVVSLYSLPPDCDAIPPPMMPHLGGANRTFDGASCLRWDSIVGLNYTDDDFAGDGGESLS